MPSFFSYLKIFNFTLSPSNIATSILFGITLGLLPLFTPITWLILALIFIIRLNFVYLTLFWSLGEIIGLLAHDAIAMLGESILSSEIWQPLWQQWYNLSFWRLLSYNHSYVMGVSWGLIIAALPVWIGCYFLAKHTQEASITKKITQLISLPVIRLFFAINKNEQQNRLPYHWFNIPGSVFLLVLVILVGSVVYFVQTSAIKHWVNQHISAQWGAPVDVGNVSLSLSPIGFSVEDLRLSGLKNAENEALYVGNFTVHVSLYHLISGQWIIDKLQISNIRSDINELSVADNAATGQRNNKNNTDTTNNQSSSSMPSIEELVNVPSVEELLGGELITKQQTANLQAAIELAKQDSQQLQQSLPKEAQYQRHLQQLNALQQQNIDLAGVPKLIEQTNHLKSLIDSDLSQLQQALEQLDGSIDSAQRLMQQLPQASENDWQKIQQTYSLSSQGKIDFVALLIGDEMNEWVQYGRLIYQYLTPYLKSSSTSQTTEQPINYFDWGRYIAFAEDDPQPDFNIRSLLAEGDNGNWQLQLENVNFDHSISQLATTGQLIIDKTKRPKVMSVMVDHRDTKAIINQLRFDSGQYTITDKVIIENDQLSLIIGQGKEVQKMQLTLSDNNQLKGFWQQDYTNIIWHDEKMNQARGNQMRPGLFSKISDFQNRVNISGRIDAPEVSLTSNLDNRLGSILQEAASQQFNQVKQQARTTLNQQVSDALQQSKSSLISIAKTQENIKTQKRKWERQLEQPLSDLSKKIEQKARSKVEEKLKDNVLKLLQ